MDHDAVCHLDGHAAVRVSGLQHHHSGLRLAQRQSDGRTKSSHVSQARHDLVGLLGDREPERQPDVALVDPGVPQGMVDEQSDRDKPRWALRDRRLLLIVEPGDRLTQSVVALDELGESVGGCFG
jgi:hypothetical protein